MKFVLKRIHFIVGLFGFNPIVFINFFRGFPSYLKDYIVLSNQLKKGKKVFSFGSFYPIFDDKFSESASIRSHYFHQDLLVAQRVYANKPQKHISLLYRTTF